MTDLAAEVEATRCQARLFALAERDHARGRVDVRGSDAERGRDGMVTNETRVLSPGGGCYAALLTPKGRIVADLHVLAREDGYWLDTSAWVVPNLLQRLERYIVADDVKLTDRTADFGRFSLEGPEATARLVRHFETADNMTDTQAALALLADGEGSEREAALLSFYDRWKNDPLVLDKWFSVQAASKREDTVHRVVALAEHPDFSLRNPNRVRSLIGVFCVGNQVRFHGIDGAGYRLLADTVIALAANPQVAARMASNFNSWKRFDLTRQSLLKAELERIVASKPLSDDVFEIVSRALD